MPLADILRGDNALEQYLGLPRGALAKRRLQNRPVPPGVLPPHTKSRLYVVEDVMAWLREHTERFNDHERHDPPKMTPQPDTRDPSVPGRRRGRPKKGVRR
ncbi:MAG: hypothetical protein ACYCRH_03490 [Acidiferrobacteraceae bacterium]